MGPLRSDVSFLQEEAARLVQGWTADDMLTYSNDEWPTIKWKRFHSTLYHYKVEVGDGMTEINLWPAYDRRANVYVSDKWEPFIATMREAMWALQALTAAPVRVGVLYIALQGKPCWRRRWTIPLYDDNPFTPRA